MLVARRSRPRDDHRSGLATDVPVGEAITFNAPHGTGWLLFSILAKEVGAFLGEADDSVELRLVIHRKQGQLARVSIRAPACVRVGLPQKK